MGPTRSLLALLLVSAASAGLAGGGATARAQMGPGMMGGGQMMGRSHMDGMGDGHMPMMGRGHMAGMGMMWGARHIEGRIAFLKVELKITDAQAPQWNAVADAMRANAKSTEALLGTAQPMMDVAKPLPERLAAWEKAATARLEAIRNLKAAIEPLYAVLDADQKKTADELLVGRLGMGMGMGMCGPG